MGSRVGVALLRTHTEMTIIGVRNTTVTLAPNKQKQEAVRRHSIGSIGSNVINGMITSSGITGSIGSLYSNESIASIDFSCSSGSICGSEKEEETENFFFHNFYASDPEYFLSLEDKHELPEEDEICNDATKILIDASSSEKSYDSFYENHSNDDFYPELFGLLEDPGV